MTGVPLNHMHKLYDCDMTPETVSLTVKPRVMEGLNTTRSTSTGYRCTLKLSAALNRIVHLLVVIGLCVLE